VDLSTSDRKIPVKLRGTLVFFAPSWFLCFIKDEAGIIYADVQNPPIGIPQGAEIEVTGYIGKGKNGPIITGREDEGASLRQIGPVHWPPAKAERLAVLGTLEFPGATASCG